MEKIVLEWKTETIEDEARVTAMYCFKSCSVNQNQNFTKGEGIECLLLFKIINSRKENYNAKIGTES